MTLETQFLNLCFGIWTFIARIVVFVFHPLVKKYILHKVNKKYGQTCNGPSPGDIQILSEEYFTRVGVHWSLGFGEAFLDGLWTAKDIPGMIGRAMRFGAFNEMAHPLTFLFKWLNLQRKGVDADAVAEHYEFGNDWYEALIGPSMQYTCAYWKTATTLEEAQFDKLELIARKLKLKPGMRVCDIGCGWGSLATHLAKHHQVSVVCITNAAEQAKFIRGRMGNLPVQVHICDYREMESKDIGVFDRVTAVGLTEHIGLKNLSSYFRLIRRVVKDDGLVLLQTIMRNDENMRYGTDLFSHKYIFPNAWATSHVELMEGIRGLLTVEDWVTHGHYYARTLEAWKENLYKMWPKFEAQYNQRVFRIWDYYLCAAIALFQERQLTLCQIVLSKSTVGVARGHYEAVR